MDSFPKRITTTLILPLLVSSAFAQTVFIPSATSGIGSSSNGNVGVGTASPTASLDIRAGSSTTLFAATGGAGSWAAELHNFDGGGDRYVTLAGGTHAAVFMNGNVGIGTTSPLQPLSVIGLPNATALFNVGKEGDHYGSWMGGSQGNDPHVWVGDWYSAGGGLTWDSSRGALLLDTYAPTQDLLVANTGGNVGIGTAHPTHKLAVNGTIRAKEVIVDTGWADYVFEEDYRLAPLVEVEKYIRENKRLPGIPSSAEVEAGGVSLGDMQSKLLAKVEEMTLHLIRIEKENAFQFARLEKLEQENQALRHQLSSYKINP